MLFDTPMGKVTKGKFDRLVGFGKNCITCYSTLRWEDSTKVLVMDFHENFTLGLRKVLSMGFSRNFTNRLVRGFADGIFGKFY